MPAGATSLLLSNMSGTVDLSWCATGPLRKSAGGAVCASRTTSGHRVGGLRRRFGGAAALHLPQKRFHHRQGPQSGAVVALARLVLLKQGGDRAGVEQARNPRAAPVPATCRAGAGAAGHGTMRQAVRRNPASGGRGFPSPHAVRAPS